MNCHAGAVALALSYVLLHRLVGLGPPDSCPLLRHLWTADPWYLDTRIDIFTHSDSDPVTAFVRATALISDRGPINWLQSFLNCTARGGDTLRHTSAQLLFFFQPVFFRSGSTYRCLRQSSLATSTWFLFWCCFQKQAQVFVAFSVSSGGFVSCLFPRLQQLADDTQADREQDLWPMYEDMIVCQLRDEAAGVEAPGVALDVPGWAMVKFRQHQRMEQATAVQLKENMARVRVSRLLKAPSKFGRCHQHGCKLRPHILRSGSHRGKVRLCCGRSFPIHAACPQAMRCKQRLRHDPI